MRRMMIVGLAAGVAVAVVAGFTAVTTARAGGGCHQPVTDARGTTVDLKQNCMSPTVLRAEPGEAITFTNRDQAVHTVTGAGTGAGQGWGSYDELTAHAALTVTFEEDGIYPYFCVLHPSMIGVVVVGDGGSAGADTTAAAAGLSGARAPQIEEAGDGGPGVIAASAGGAGATLAVVAVAFGLMTIVRRHARPQI